MNKKSLKQAYKEQKQEVGIYLIESEFDANVYLGSAIDLPARINRHKAEFRFGTHRVKKLQEIWNTYGPEAIRFRILDRLEQDEKLKDPQKELKALTELWKEKLVKEGYSLIEI